MFSTLDGTTASGTDVGLVDAVVCSLPAYCHTATALHPALRRPLPLPHGRPFLSRSPLLAFPILRPKPTQVGATFLFGFSTFLFSTPFAFDFRSPFYSVLFCPRLKNGLEGASIHDDGSNDSNDNSFTTLASYDSSNTWCSEDGDSDCDKNSDNGCNDDRNKNGADDRDNGDDGDNSSNGNDDDDNGEGDGTCKWQ